MNDQRLPTTPTRRRRQFVAGVSLLVLAVALAACRAGGPGSGGDGPGGTDGTDGTDGNGEIAHPEGSELVLRVETCCGFVPREYVLSAVPDLTLLGDGRLITVGPQLAIYPGPALPNLQERRLSESGIQEVLTLVSDTGLFEASAEFDAASNFIADAPTTIFTLTTSAGTVVVSVYGLGALSDGIDDSMIPEAERAAHERLLELRDQLFVLESSLPAEAWADDGSQPFVASAVRLYVRNADADPPDESGVEPSRKPWPLGVPPEEFGSPLGNDAPERCGVVTGAEANQLLEALTDANQLTQWESGGSVYALIARPLLPDEAQTCP